MPEAISGNIEYEKRVISIDFEKKEVETADGSSYCADVIITTILWMEFEKLIGMPEELKTSIGELKYSSIQTEYFPQNMDSVAHWIYYPDQELAYHRILVPHNFCPNSRGHWTETNSERIGLAEKKGTYQYLRKCFRYRAEKRKTMAGSAVQIFS